MYMSALVIYLLLFITLHIRGEQEMSTLHDKTHCVVCSAETRSDLQMQCNFRAKYWRAPQSRPSICKWHKQFVETVGVVWQTGYGDASSSPEDVERIPEFLRVVCRNTIFVCAAMNCIYHARQCARCYTQGWDYKLARIKPCRMSGPMIFRYFTHSPKTQWNDCTKIIDS